MKELYYDPQISPKFSQTMLRRSRQRYDSPQQTEYSSTTIIWSAISLGQWMTGVSRMFGTMAIPAVATSGQTTPVRTIAVDPAKTFARGQTALVTLLE